MREVLVVAVATAVAVALIIVAVNSAVNSAVQESAGWIIELRLYSPYKTVVEKYYYINGELYKYDDGAYWRMGKVTRIRVENITAGGFELVFLRYRGAPPPTNDTLVKASFQVIRDSHIYNVTIETQYSQLLAVLNAMCKGPDNKVVALPFADVAVDYWVVSKTETKTIDLGRVAVNAAGDICAVYIDKVEVHK